MKRTFTIMQVGLMMAALDKLEGNKGFMAKLIKMEDALTLTPVEQERTGAVMAGGDLIGPRGCQDLKVKRDLDLKAMLLIQRAVNSCRTWRGQYKREVVALSKKLDKMVSDEQAVVAWDKLPKKERDKRLKAKEKEKTK